MEVLFSPDIPPLSVIVAAEVAGLVLSQNATLPPGSVSLLVLASGKSLNGVNVALRYYIGRIMYHLYGGDGYQKNQIDEWIDFVPKFSCVSEFEGACTVVDMLFQKKTWLVGYSLSMADLAVWAGLVENEEERRDSIESRCRNNSVEDNLDLWQEMIAGSQKGLLCCLRGKLEMNNLNMSLRDPVYYRCNLAPHHRVGTKYKLYPTYDFCCPFVDSVEGITHAFRSRVYLYRIEQYHGIQMDMGLRMVRIYDCGL